MEKRPAVGRRRAIQEAMADRAEGEERADVARRLDRIGRRPGRVVRDRLRPDPDVRTKFFEWRARRTTTTSRGPRRSEE